MVTEYNNESCESRALNNTSSSPAQSRQQRQKLGVYREVLSHLKDSKNDEAIRPGFNDELWAHFNRLPTWYALDVNVERAEDVLMHKRLLHLAHDPAHRPAIEVHLVQVRSMADMNAAVTMNTDPPGKDAAQSSNISNRQSIHPPPAFDSSPNLEALALEANKSEDHDAEPALHARTQFTWAITHEITFSTDDKSKLLSQLTSLLADIGLNIQEAHAFSILDGYSLDVFVVDGWRYEETEKLKIAIQKEVLKIERPWPPTHRSSSFGGEHDQVVIKTKPDHLEIPNDGTDVWELDPRQLKVWE